MLKAVPWKILLACQKQDPSFSVCLERYLLSPIQPRCRAGPTAQAPQGSFPSVLEAAEGGLPELPGIQWSPKGCSDCFPALHTQFRHLLLRLSAANSFCTARTLVRVCCCQPRRGVKKKKPQKISTVKAKHLGPYFFYHCYVAGSREKLGSASHHILERLAIFMSAPVQNPFCMCRVVFKPDTATLS